MVMLMAAAGFFLGSLQFSSIGLLLWTLVGTGFSSAGASVLNNYLERDSDALMHRTKNRPIPRGAISPADALSFGLILVLIGIAVMVTKVNLLTGFISLLTVFLYVLVYTPLKKLTWLNTFIGAIPGALPPVGGWTAATNSVETGALALFLILFIWQHPHFYAIAWMYKEDYTRGGLKMLPVVEPDGSSTFRQVLIYSLLLLPASALPTVIGLSGSVYLAGVLASGVVLLLYGILLTKTASVKDARKLLHASIIYLPVFFALILADSLV